MMNTQATFIVALLIENTNSVLSGGNTMTSELLAVWSDSPAVSLVIWAAIAIIIFYLGRKQAHQVLHSTGVAIYNTMRIWGF